MGGEGHGNNGPPKYALVSTFRPIKVLMVDFQKRVLIKRRSLLFMYITN